MCTPISLPKGTEMNLSGSIDNNVNTGVNHNTHLHSFTWNFSNKMKDTHEWKTQTIISKPFVINHFVKKALLWQTGGRNWRFRGASVNIQRALMQICHREILCLDFIIPNFTSLSPNNVYNSCWSTTYLTVKLFMKRLLLAHLICLNAQDLNCTLMFGKIWFRLSQILATSYMVLMKLFPSAAPIHPHHTINAERCQIASLKRHNCKKKRQWLWLGLMYSRKRSRTKQNSAWLGCRVRA